MKDAWKRVLLGTVLVIVGIFGGRDIAAAVGAAFGVISQGQSVTVTN